MNKKTIWITGGSSGIGKAVAIKFANEGWNVAISARRKDLLNEISDKNENIEGFPLDVTDKSKCNEVFEEIKKKFKDIDICFFSSIFEATVVKSLFLDVILFLSVFIKTKQPVP